MQNTPYFDFTIFDLVNLEPVHDHPVPTKLTPAVAKAVYSALLEGLSRTQAAGLVQIPYETFRYWLAKNRKFKAMVLHAEAHVAREAMQRVFAGMADDPNIAMKFLERRFPQEYGKDATTSADEDRATMVTVFEDGTPTDQVGRDPLGQKLLPDHISSAEGVASGEFREVESSES